MQQQQPLKCKGCVCCSSLQAYYCTAASSVPAPAGCWIIVEMWCPVGEVVEWVNPECSCLHKLCWSLQPSQLICCPRSAKSLFYFDIFCDLCGYNCFKISWLTLRCFLLLRDSNIFTLRSDCCFVFVAESNTKGQQLGLRRRLPCFSFSSSPSPCQGPASAELDPFAGICRRPIW